MLRRLFAILLLVVATCLNAAQDPPVIAAASDLRYALDEIAGAFDKATGRTIRVSYGSSGNFLQQITHGAPFEMFLSADEDYINRLAAQGLTQGTGTLYAVGRLVLFIPKTATFKASELGQLRQPLADGRIKRFAIANPQHAPYGRAAVEALKAAGVWESIEPKLVYGDNVSQAALMTISGSTDGGIFALSLAKAPGFAAAGTAILLPQNMHRPLKQRMALLTNATATTKAFYSFLQEPAARAIFKKYGFLLPGE